MRCRFSFGLSDCLVTVIFSAWEFSTVQKDLSSGSFRHSGSDFSLILRYGRNAIRCSAGLRKLATLLVNLVFLASTKTFHSQGMAGRRPSRVLLLHPFSTK